VKIADTCQKNLCEVCWYFKKKTLNQTRNESNDTW